MRKNIKFGTPQQDIASEAKKMATKYLLRKNKEKMFMLFDLHYEHK